MPFLQSNTLDCKNGIVFAYQFVPFNSSNWGRGELQKSAKSVKSTGIDFRILFYSIYAGI